MPRDANGNYTLVAGNPVVAGTPITTSWANPTLQDMANSMTNSLSRNGLGGMLVPFKNDDGSIGLPGITWTNETKTGFYRADTNDMRVSVNAIDKLRWTETAVQIWNGSTWENIAVTSGFADYLPLTGGTVTGQVKGIAPLVAEDLTRKDYVDGLDAQNVKLTGDQTIAGQKTFGSNVLITVSQSAATNSLTRRDYVDAGLGSKLPLAGGTVTGQIKGITPVAAADLTRKDYVDSIGGASGSFVTGTGAIKWVGAKGFTLGTLTTGQAQVIFDTPEPDDEYIVIMGGQAPQRFLLGAASVTGFTVITQSDTGIAANYGFDFKVTR